MKTQADKPSYLPLVIAGIAVILFSTAGLARMMGWGPDSIGDSGDGFSPNQAAPGPVMGEMGAKRRCAECGMIVSVREVERHDQDSDTGAAAGVTSANRDETRGKSVERYEIIVRMADGSNRVIDDANPARWRAGERLIVIGDAQPSSR